MKNAADAEDVRLPVLYITKGKFGRKLQGLEFSCLFQELKYLIFAFSVMITLVLRHVPRKLYQ